MSMQMTNKKVAVVLGGAVLLMMLIATAFPSAFTPLREESQTSDSDEGWFGGSAGGMGTVAPSMPDKAQDAVGRPPMIAPSPFPGTAGETAAEVDQRIIKTGSLSIVVDDAPENSARVITLAQGKGGFVQNSTVSEREDGTRYGTVTIRVPAKDFETTMADIRKLANVVENESVSGQDVTEQFTDLEAQLRNAKAQETQYLDILKRAVTVEDILSVQRELGNIRAQIESLTGRLQYLENVTSYSTISVFLSEEPVIRVPTKEFRPVTIVREAAQALVALIQVLATYIIWLIIVGGGLLLPLGLLAYIAYRILRRMMYRNVRPTPPPRR